MLMRSTVTHKGQGSSEIKLGEKCNVGTCIILLIKKAETKLQSNLMHQETCYQVSGWGLVKLSY